MLCVSYCLYYPFNRAALGIVVADVPPAHEWGDPPGATVGSDSECLWLVPGAAMWLEVEEGD